MKHKQITANSPSNSWEIVKKTFRERFLAAAVLLVAVFIAIQFLPSVGFFFVLQVIILFSLVEFYNLFSASSHPPFKMLGVFLGLMISSSFLFEDINLHMVLLGCLFLTAVYPLLFHKKRDTLDNFAGAMALTLVGPLYLNLTLNFIYLLHLERGIVYIYFLVVVIVCGDTGAYFIGKFWGKRKLAPKVSPRKTWEGSLGGIVCAVLGGLLVHILLIKDIAVEIVVLVAFSVHVVAQVGDLLESLFKRAAGKKDSSRILGGHGGFLDRVDSFILAAPFFYYILLIVGLD